MKKTIMIILVALALAGMFIFFETGNVYASDGPEEYITITVEATDNTEGLQYAIDRPENFTTENTFRIPAGTSHTIYVRDAAGNMTTQEYVAPVQESATTVSSETAKTESITAGEGDQEINIELELGMESDKIGKGSTSTSDTGTSDYANYDYMTDSVLEEAPATVQSKMTTDGSDLAEKVFYTVQTAEGETFYLVIEQGSSNGVHLLNTVTLDDLEIIAEAHEGNSANNETGQEENLLAALQSSNTPQEEVAGTDESGNRGSIPLILLFLVVAGGGYYYFMIYRNKKNAAMDVMDAMDMDEFVPESEEDEDEELTFDDEEKQRMLDELIASEYMNGEDLLDQDPESYSDNSSAISMAMSEAEEFDEELDGEEE